MKPLKIYADFNYADPAGRLRLNCAGTKHDLERLKIQFSEGQTFLFGDEDLEVQGKTTFSNEEKIWVAEIDWGRIRDLNSTNAGPSQAGMTDSLSSDAGPISRDQAAT